MSSKEKILILFDGPHLAYAPTVIQLYHQLSDKYSVSIIAQDAKNYTGELLSIPGIFYYRYYQVKERHFYLIWYNIISVFNRTVKLFRKNNLGYRDYFFRFLFIKKKINSEIFKTIICVDIANLFFCSLLKRKVDFLSLEVCKDHHLLKMVNKKESIKSVIIQSPERYNYLFPDDEFETFFVQNAPIYKERIIPSERQHLIYTGAANDVFGFYQCLDYLKSYPGEKMTVQGAVLPDDRKKIGTDYSVLLKEGRLTINDIYVGEDDIIDLISKFEIGFCFYNFNHPFVHKNRFNYLTAPSGKMFKYLAAGVPVVCSNIPGFDFVNQFRCGVPIQNLTDEEIRKAIVMIRSNYTSYAKNALKAAKYFSFDKSIEPYLRYLTNPVPGAHERR